MKTLTILVMLVLAGFESLAQVSWQQLTQLQSSGGNVQSRGVALDGYGGSVVTGSFRGTICFDKLTLTSRGSEDLFVVRYGAQGRAVWAAQFGQNSSAPSYYQASASGKAIAMDAAGNVYVLGNFTGSISYSGGTLQNYSDGFQTGLITKINSRGQVQWAQRFGIRQFSCYAYAIATDATGTSYITGQSDYGNIEFGNKIHSPGSRRVMYVAAYRTTGEVAWAKVSGNYSTFGASGSDVALDGRGNCYVGGFFNNDMTLDGAALTTIGTDSYLARLSTTTGALQWLKQGGGTGTPSANNNVRIATLATDRLGNVYVAGEFSGVTSLGGHPLLGNDAGQTDLFVARYTQAGVVQWARSTGTPAPEYSTQLVTDADGFSTLVGQRLNQNFEPKLLLHSFQPNGVLYTSDVVGTTGSCRGYDLAQSTSGQLYLAGTLAGTASFGPTTLQTADRTDGFVARLTIRQPTLGTRPTLEVFPNPARGRIVARLVWGDAGMRLGGKATLTNALGLQVAVQTISASPAAHLQATFDCTSLPNGLYVLQLTTSDGASYSQGVEVR
ncbi:hypothetical protein [Hymenobacter pini]|uniref:hypothetical protein n=1 Tax=Hymenobacter pini TaxID=2880879 RepID=UPI001CF23036|nr:hypothetical protein [Hymenobacter pini]MCA8831891.1 hypothetical protein [Hymenobacter pini]